MTATRIATVPSTRPARTTGLGRTGVRSGLTAAAATVAVAAAASAVGVSLEAAPGEAIPVLGFGPLTLMCTLIGVVLAGAIGRWARQPRSTFVTATVVLTVLSLIPDAVLSADVATKVTLMLTHVLAAAIVIPALSARLPEECARPS